jgi:uncharacterized membrane protein
MKKKFLSYFLVLILSVVLLLIPTGSVVDESTSSSSNLLEGEIIKASDFDSGLQFLEVKLDNGPVVSFDNDESLSVNPRLFEVGDDVVLASSKLQNGLTNYYVTDYQRRGALLMLFLIFVGAVLIVARWQGLGSIMGMFFSFLVLFKVVLPQILNGTDPVLAAISGTILIIPVAFYLSHGFNRKTHVAVLGTFVTLIVTGILAKVFAELGSLSGLASEEAGFLKLETASNIDFGGIVLAGMIISVLGILDDITISQSSIVSQLKGAKKNISFKELYSRSMAVGRDHISSLVNTLVLVYTGASLPLLLLFLDHSQPFLQIINLEFIAEEIILTLVGSIGLIMAVPLTTFIACIITDGKSTKPHCHH